MRERVKVERGSGNVFVDLGFASDEAHNLLLRSELMMRVARFVKVSGLTQKQAAVRLGITQPRLNDVLKGRIDKFSMDALVNMLAKAGLRVKLTVRKAA